MSSDYINDLAMEIMEHAEVDSKYATSDQLTLYRIYAVLALAKGVNTTAEDVHNAWSAWVAGTFTYHRSLLPFNELTPEVQRLDDPFVEAIHKTASQRLKQSP